MQQTTAVYITQMFYNTALDEVVLVSIICFSDSYRPVTQPLFSGHFFTFLPFPSPNLVVNKMRCSIGISSRTFLTVMQITRVYEM